MEKITEVNRLEVIDWTKSNGGVGRAFVKRVKDNFEVYYQMQDDGKTVKIFLIDKESAYESKG